MRPSYTLLSLNENLLSLYSCTKRGLAFIPNVGGAICRTPICFTRYDELGFIL